MADWIKMRSSLLTNPRVTRMARLLLQDAEFLAWMYSGRDVTRDESVTKRDIPVVTRIVVGGLLPVWSMANETAGRDGVVRHASSHEVDDAAGIPGFFRALTAVEWAEELDDQSGVRFINFEEHNSPQKERSLTGKSGAERTKEYRERKKREAEEAAQRDAERDGPGDVTVTSHRDDREEKSRGEKKNPSGSRASSKSPRKPAGSKRVPVDFSVTADMEAWASEDAPLIDWRRETEKFRDWEFKTPRTDWAATWRTWMRKAQESAVERGQSAGASGSIFAGAI
ncbi:hypothetical protein [Hydrogenophaga sp.]|uniref:hypothetical protein n=1 Tax=Hydrogenophaga sp. TaxID=1904254 RepID=UPI002731A45F|nr:hypothetical protein [Hydrogenophaga sp.]MDP2074617.1 hypothetical protein [Hydrogenophaga sp.]MDP3106414.1 hypothetical protein [Hydrogenophaga sp.]